MLILALCAVALGQLVLGKAPQVTTSQGTMRGQVLKSRDGRDYFSFTKIPYAKPPIGELRFMISEKAENWTGILDATQQIPSCYQPISIGLGPMQEDCLYLNVFSPNLTGKYPVIFTIHGGGLVFGSADYSEHAKFFMDEDVVIVGPNYRLGTLGFLSMEDKVIPGNMGLKDQALALEWVHKEISAFGGDPNRITVIGESAGGVSADLICSAQRTNGLIKACISQSGVVLQTWLFGKPGEARQSALKLAEAVGCNATRDVLKCLQSKPVEQVGNLDYLVKRAGNKLSVFPVLEQGEVPNGFLTRWPTGTDHNYPWVVGICQDEGLANTLEYEMHNKSQKEIEKYIDDFNQTLISTHDLENRKTDFERLRARFFKKGVDPLKAIRNYYTESVFVYPSLRRLSEHPGVTYFYKFNYTRGPKSYVYNNTVLGVPHGSEMPYFFEQKSEVPNWPNNNDIALSKELVKMWVNFARDHNPNGQGIPKWSQFQGRYFLDIQNYGVSISNWTDYQETINFWKSIEGTSGSTAFQSSFLFVAAVCFFTIIKTMNIYH